MITIETIKAYKISELIEMYPFVATFFSDNGLEINGKGQLSVAEYFDSFDEDEIEDQAIDGERLIEQLYFFIDQMISFLGEEDDNVQSITIMAGNNKSGEKEQYEKLEIKKGDVVCIVGPTGSGKSRLLGDIEWVAQNDTPTSRQILVNGEIPDTKWRFSSSDKLVAQLSQNMNFVMDLTVYEFVQLHAESRMVEQQENTIRRIIDQANDLAGEQFTDETPITSLSGGQSRALMIADTAILSKSPIILIDEIENAGIDRKKALELLLSEDKIVLMATHDPILALLGDKRIVIKNGGIDKIIETTEQERTILGELEELDRTLMAFRSKLRHGEILESLKV